MTRGVKLRIQLKYNWIFYKRERERERLKNEH